MRVLLGLVLCSVSLLRMHAQWDVQPSPASADLRAVSAVSDLVAWASGAHGTVLHTTDGGASWQPCAVPPGAADLDLPAVQAFDARMALVMSNGKGERSRVYKTTDSCKTWDLVFQNPDPDGMWDSMQFQFRPGKPPDKGYFAFGVLVGHPVGGEFVIFTSKNYGVTWQALRDDEAFSPGPPAVANPGEFPFSLSNGALTAIADENSFAFVTGGPGGGRLLFPQGATYDFSYTAMKYSFSEVQLPIRSSPTGGAIAIGARHATPDRVDLMIVAGDPGNPDVGNAVFVRHGGLNVKKLLAPHATAAEHPPSGFRTAVAYDATANRWITVGPNGTDVSHDDGRTWSKLTPATGEPADADRNWQALSLPFAVGPHGRIGRLRQCSGSPMVNGR